MQLRNPFLEQVMLRVREGRHILPRNKPYYNRSERVRAGTFVEVWFMTGGCRWDHQGGCTMCNYGRGATLTSAEMVDAVRSALGDLDFDVDELLVSPSGGMLDSTEVPAEARMEIYALVRKFPCKKFLIETRSETISSDSVKELVTNVPDRALGIEVGLESSCAWIQRFCINKGSHPTSFQKAAAIVRGAGVDFYANVALGTAFLTEAEAIEDAVASARWALSNGGATHAIVFPMHVKPFTLLSHLFDKSLYTPPSLWSLVEVLRQLGPDFQTRTEIAWYRSYYNDPAKIKLSPTTCRRCRDEVLLLLDGYRATQSSEYVEALLRLSCDCKEQWHLNLELSKIDPLQDRVFASYERLARDFHLEDWWNPNTAVVQGWIYGTKPHVGGPAPL